MPPTFSESSFYAKTPGIYDVFTILVGNRTQKKTIISWLDRSKNIQ